MLKIPCTDNLFIDESHRVFHNEIELKDDYQDDKIILKIQGKTEILHREWLYLYARFQFPEFINIDHISFYQIPSFKGSFAWRAKFNKHYWYDKTHLIVPMCPNLAVSANGDVIDIITGKSRHVWREEYLIVHAFNPVYDRYKYMKVHLLVANAWVIFNQDSAHPVCNHKDGNKFNPDIHNLEWVTFQENTIHAVKTGLQPGICECRIRHIETGECFTFSTVKEAARFMHIKADHLYQRNRPLSSLVADKYEIRLSGDNRPWLYTNQYIVMNKGDKSPYVLCVSDGAIKRVFIGVKEFVQFYSLIPNAVSVRFAEAVKYFKSKYPKMILTILDKPVQRSIEIKNVETGQVHQFNSIRQAAKSLELSIDTVTYALRTEGHHLANCYRIRHYSTEKWPETQPIYKPVAISVVDKQTGTKRTFSSLTSFSKYSGLAVKLIKRMIRRGLKTDRFELHKI